jgi:hypothetical protein
MPMFKETGSIIGFLEHRTALALLLALHHLPNPHWKTIEDYWLNELGLVCFTWNSYNRLCKQLVKIGLATQIKTRANAHEYRLNDYGHQVAIAVEEALEKINSFSTISTKG